jgi:hypothetical protein
MDKGIAVFLMVGVFVVTIAVVIISWYNYRLKKRIIDSGPIDEGSIKFLKKLTDMGAEQLKWGCVLFSGGLGLIVSHYLPYDTDSSLPWGVELVFIAAGFLAYYFIIRRQGDN